LPGTPSRAFLSSEMAVSERETSFRPSCLTIGCRRRFSSFTGL
jgi:hypothetical protein